MFRALLASVKKKYVITCSRRSLSLINVNSHLAMSQIPRVSSTASELNDFTETTEGKKLYNVRTERWMSFVPIAVYPPICTSHRCPSLGC